MMDVPDGYDPDVWSALPDFIRKELQQDVTFQPPDSLQSSHHGASVLGKRSFQRSTSSKCSVKGSPHQAGVISIVRGPDIILPSPDVQRWHSFLAQQEGKEGKCALFEDEEFPANSFSICGREESAEKEDTPSPPLRPPYVVGQVPECFCHALAAKHVVKMNTPNRGREYYSCPSRRCKYFQWLDGDQQVPSLQSQRSRRRACTWTRFGVSLPLVTDYGFRAEDLLQGGVGDCWFMSALAVVAARHDLISRLLEVPSWSPLSHSPPHSSSASSSLTSEFPVFGAAGSRQKQSHLPAAMSSASQGTETSSVLQTSNAAGVYAVRLFLDGAWSTVLLDDQLPVAGKGTARRLDIAVNFSNLAFCRCGSAETGGQQLWASLIEKAYAKVHGSYEAISGGEISEALLDLTGAPSLAVDFSVHSFRSEALWAGLVRWRRAELPMGCSTDADPDGLLQQVGLYGNHAYSILDVREVTKPHGGRGVFPLRTAFASDEAWYCALSGSIDDTGGNYMDRDPAFASDVKGNVVRLIQIRNPHGVGEWTGAYSEHSEELRELALSSSGGSNLTAVAPTGREDGSFWIDYTHFLQGFSRVDVSLAYRDWKHCRSFQNYFPIRDDPWRVCATSYWLRLAPVDVGVNANNANQSQHGCVTLSALQPTRRGAWCRSDVKKSYRYGHLCLLLVKGGSEDGSRDWSVVAGSLGGASRETTIGAVLEDVEDGGRGYLLLVFCLGSPPSAAETTSQQPFSLRVTSNQALQVEEVKSSNLGSITVPESAESLAAGAEETGTGQRVTLVSFLLHLGFTQFYGVPSLSSVDCLSSESDTTGVTTAAFKSDMAALQEPVVREVRCLTPGVLVLTMQSSSSLVVLLFNTNSSTPCSDTISASRSADVSVLVHAKSAVARDKHGLIKDNKDISKAYNDFMQEASRAAPSSTSRSHQQGSFRYPTRWSSYETRCSVRAGEGRLCLLLTSGGVQYQTQGLQFTCRELSRGEAELEGHPLSLKATAINKSAEFMQSWASTKDRALTVASKRAPKLSSGSLFDPFVTQPAHVAALLVEAAVDKPPPSDTHPSVDRDCEMLTSLLEREDADTQAAIERSLLSDVPTICDHDGADDAAYRAAIEASLVSSDEVATTRPVATAVRIDERPHVLVDLTADALSSDMSSGSGSARQRQEIVTTSSQMCGGLHLGSGSAAEVVVLSDDD